MRRSLSLLLTLVLLMSSTFAHGTMEDKLANHWSKGLIDRSFVSYYFPFLARDNFSRLDPNEAILQEDFNLSVAALFKEYGYEIPGIGSTGILTRKDMVSSLGEKLLRAGIESDKSTVLPFRDINKMDSNSIDLLGLLYTNGIIEGDSNSIFSPNRNLSQAEAIIILQRMKGVLGKMQEIPFKTLGVIQSFNNQEELVVTQNGENVLVTITKEFPTPGYGMSVERITKEENGYKIHFDIKPPAPDSIQLQVMTYKTITIGIDKEDIEEPPYNFLLEGYNKTIQRDTI